MMIVVKNKYYPQKIFSARGLDNIYDNVGFSHCHMFQIGLRQTNKNQTKTLNGFKVNDKCLLLYMTLVSLLNPKI